MSDGARRIDGERELEQLSAVLAWAFNSPAQGIRKWLTSSGLENVRVVHRGTRVVGGLVQIPLGQWFGGRSVPMLGIAGVGVAPEARGKGVALGMMTETLREARQRGFALSALYPATVALYRGVGYELAGSHCRWRVPPKACSRRKTPLELTSLAAADLARVEHVYAACARTRPGYLDRSPYIWDRVRSPRDEPAVGYAAVGKDGIEGYLYALQKTAPSGTRQMLLSDLVASTPAAFDALVSFLASHRTVIDEVVWHGGLADATVLGFPERSLTVELVDNWMLRVVDARAALLARGYPPVDVALTLEIHDDLLPENDGRFRLSTTLGQATLEASASADVRLDIRALAALYTGFMSPDELARAGLLACDADTRAKLALLFSGPAPALPDFF